MDRRQLLRSSLAASAAILSIPVFSNASEPTWCRDKVKFTMDLCPGRVGIDANPFELIELAKRNGFTSVQPNVWELEKLSAGKVEELNGKAREAGLVWSAADLPVEFRKSDEKFADDMKWLTPKAKALQSIGVTRMGTWIMPCHDELTYMGNFRQHAARLGRIGTALEEYGIRLGLEYVGTKSLWTSKKFPFLHTMREVKDLIAEAGRSNIGLVLDSWHWTMAGENGDDIRSLKNEEIVACDLNDAPAGIEQDEQKDTIRELPLATGVIDTSGFLQALADIGYDGPVRAEPFNKSLYELGDAEAAAKTAAAMKKAFALVGG